MFGQLYQMGAELDRCRRKRATTLGQYEHERTRRRYTTARPVDYQEEAPIIMAGAPVVVPPKPTEADRQAYLRSQVRQQAIIEQREAEAAARALKYQTATSFEEQQARTIAEHERQRLAYLKLRREYEQAYEDQAHRARRALEREGRTHVMASSQREALARRVEEARDAQRIGADKARGTQREVAMQEEIVKLADDMADEIERRTGKRNDGGGVPILPLVAVGAALLLS